MTAPFEYPETPHVRRHGPRGYADFASFQPWLRDEFDFRCVYCLFREQWSRHGALSIDHFLAVAVHPDKAGDYENLVYACPTCNAAKGDRTLPDPCQVLTTEAVTVLEDGTIHTTSAEAARLIELLGLDGRHSNEFRQLWIGIVALAARYDVPLYERLMGFPDDLPNLGRLRPPDGNLRPQGINESWHVRKRNGTLPTLH